jgi:hypothetical protein
MRVPPDEYLRLPLRAHELLRGVRLYDVSIVDLPGGGDGRTLADLRALNASAPPSGLAKALFALRMLLGRVFHWDQTRIRPEQSLLPRLSDEDRSTSQITPGTSDGSFLTLYQFPHESLSEILNATVHGFICTALVPAATGYRLYWGIYVMPVSWITRPYLLAIEPFRRVLYPALFRRILRAWVGTYGGSRAS